MNRSIFQRPTSASATQKSKGRCCSEGLDPGKNFKVREFGIFHVFSSPFQSGENPYVVLPCGFVSCFLFTLLILIFQDLTFMFTSRLMCMLKPRESLLCFETLKSLKSWGLTVFIHSGKLSFKENRLSV